MLRGTGWRDSRDRHITCFDSALSLRLWSPAMPNKAAFYLARSAVGNLTQTRSADDPVLIDARRRMEE